MAEVPSQQERFEPYLTISRGNALSYGVEKWWSTLGFACGIA